jgi:hypothetical protein
MTERRSDDGWITHDGKERPVERDVIVEVKTRDQYIHTPNSAGFWGNGARDESNWWHEQGRPHRFDIIAYRVVPA